VTNFESWWAGAFRSGVARPVEAFESAIARAVEQLSDQLRPAWMLRVVCTDGGQHKEATVGVIARTEGASEYEFGTDTSKKTAEGVLNLDPKHAEPVREDRGFGRLVVWSCPRCTRRPSWTWDHAQDHARRLEAAWPGDRVDMTYFRR